MPPKCRCLLLGLAWLALTENAAGDPGPVSCTAFAEQTIRWVVPSKPGGGYDAYSRLIQPLLEQSLGANIFIENRPEAGGIVGAVAIRDAQPDGKTLGLINASGLLAAHMSGREAAPDPSEDFTVLARVVTNQMLLFTGRDSGISDIHQLLRMSAAEPVVVGVRDAGSAGFFAFPIVARYLGLNYALVTGYVGSTSRVLAALRGEVDIILQTLDSVWPFVVSGELLPLLWISGYPQDGAGDDLPFTAPTLGEVRNLTALEEENSGAMAEDVKVQATAVSSILSAGRVVVAPLGLPAGIESCLQATLVRVLRSAELQQKARDSNLTLEPADASTTREELRASKRHMQPYVPLVRATIEQAHH